MYVVGLVRLGCQLTGDCLTGQGRCATIIVNIGSLYFVSELMLTIINTNGGKSAVGRLPKWRRVAFMPQVTYFKPAAIPLSSLEEVCLSVEEAEAIRLKDLEELEQEDCAQKMSISRPTFHRLLVTARKKIADALVTGKAIRIEGGNFEMAVRRFHCLNGHEWDVPFEVMIDAPPQFCPICNTPNIMPIQPAVLCGSGRGWGRRASREGNSPLLGNKRLGSR